MSKERAADRQLAGRIQSRREEVALLELTLQLVAGRNDRPEEGGGP
jgi:hypothetical protein